MQRSAQSFTLLLATALDSGENPRMRVKKKASRPKPPRRILVIDVGGSSVKFRVGDHGEIQKFPSGPKMSAGEMVEQMRRLTAKTPYDAVSIGYPGLVFRGTIAAEPYNLGGGWVGFDFGEAFGKPVRVINDAAMQAIGSYTGGRMLFLGLGTGLGATLILDGVVEPLEIGHMPYKHGRSFEDYVGKRALERFGTKKWRKQVNDVVDQLKKALEVAYVVLGGGNAKRLKRLPKDTRLSDNRNAFVGGPLIWQKSDIPPVLSSPHRSRVAVSKK
jgi:polyphosphate glucokinase